MLRARDREVDEKALRGLVTLRDLLGEQFRAGFFLNTGTEAYRVDDSIYVCPAARLWQTSFTTTSPMSAASAY